MHYLSLFAQPRFAFGAAVLTLLASCNSADTARTEPASAAARVPADPAAPSAIMNTLENDALATGKALFQQNCAVCHGKNGKLGLNGARDLTKSNLTALGRVYIVTNGLGKMPTFKGRLTEQEIEQVVAYSLTLRQQ